MLTILFTYDERGNKIDSAVFRNKDRFLATLGKYPNGSMEWLIPEPDEVMGVMTIHLGKGVIPPALLDLVSRAPDHLVVNTEISGMTIH